MTDITDIPFLKNLRRLPKELIDIIFGYYYSCKPMPLCIDIKDYYFTKIFATKIYQKRVNNWNYHSSNWLYSELMLDDLWNYCNSYYMKKKMAAFVFHFKKLREFEHWSIYKIADYMENYFANKPISSQINILL